MLTRITAALVLLCMLALPADAHRAVRHSSWHHSICFTTGYLATGYQTATGTWPRIHHTVATIPAFIPYGAQVRLGGLPWTYRAEDTGNLRLNQIDVFVGSLAEAYAITGFRQCWWRYLEVQQ